MLLPVADSATVRKHTWDLLRHYRGALAGVIVLHSLAALAGVARPWILGALVDAVTGSTTAQALNILVACLAIAVVAQAVFIRFAQRSSMVLGETVFAKLREDFMDQMTALPLSVVESAGTGDLVARTTNDVDRISYSVRYGVPRILVAVVTIALTLVAVIASGPLLSIAVLVGVPILVVATRWYLKRAPAGYQREMASYAVLNGSITETVDGAETVEALGLGKRRRERIDKDLRECFASEKYTLGLRSIFFPFSEFAFLLPVVAVLAWGGYLYIQGHVTLGQVTAVAMYALQLVDPVDELISWLDEIQIGATSLSRMIGINAVPSDRVATGEKPDGEQIVADQVRFAYREGRDVLHDVDLTLAPGERLAVVGPSGAGKSTLGRLLAGINPPTAGSMTVGGVALVNLDLGELRSQVALVTQEHHVFVGSLADNLLLAKVDATADEMQGALRAVDALGWAMALPHGMDTEVGSGGLTLTPAQAQQLALARLVLLNPNTLVLDEATSLIDPRSARSLEASLSNVLEGRTVVAIAHRLHTAHDADRVAVVDGGRIVEIGSHDELVAAGGDYAALWASWQN